MKSSKNLKIIEEIVAFDEIVNYRGGRYYTSLLELVRELRKKQTTAEQIFWELVRNKRFLGLKLRRQHQIGTYIVDFFCPSEKLIIEIDGKIHLGSNQKKKDISRDLYLKELGCKIVRFANDKIYNDIEMVIKTISKLV